MLRKISTLSHAPFSIVDIWFSFSIQCCWFLIWREKLQLNLDYFSSHTAQKSSTRLLPLCSRNVFFSWFVGGKFWSEFSRIFLFRARNVHKSTDCWRVSSLTDDRVGVDLFFSREFSIFLWDECKVSIERRIFHDFSALSRFWRRRKIQL